MIAPGRGRRPGAWLPPPADPTDEELDRCPFCGGREDRTPPETLRLGDPWRVRVVPNLYPAFDRQEVVVHGPEHVRSFTALGDDQVALVAEAWRLRIEAARAEGLTYVHALVNEGRLAGASLAHSHSQLVALREAPPAVVAERDTVADVLGRDELVVLTRGGARAVVHWAGAAPYEGLVAGGALPDILTALRDYVAALVRVEGPLAWNAWLHDGAAPHLHVVPRLTALAGIELGAGLYVNVVPPEQAAEALRA